MNATSHDGALPVWMIGLCSQVDLDTESIDVIDPKKAQEDSQIMSKKELRRLSLFREYRGRCFYCETKMRFKDASADHVRPKSKGGSDSNENLVLCCEYCNRAKGTKSLKQFLELLQRRVEKLHARAAESFPELV